jgi:hypothetical protein
MSKPTGLKAYDFVLDGLRKDLNLYIRLHEELRAANLGLRADYEITDEVVKQHQEQVLNLSKRLAALETFIYKKDTETEYAREARGLGYKEGYEAGIEHARKKLEGLFPSKDYR